MLRASLKHDISPMGERNRRETNKQHTLTRIETAAWELFCEKGYEATSTRAVADRAGIATGTLFNYFPEKRTILLQLMRRRLDDAAQVAFDTLPATSLLAQLEHVFGHLYASHGCERRLGRVFVKELLFVDGPLRTDTAMWTYGLIERIAELVAIAQSTGSIGRQIDPLDAAAQMFGAYYFGLVTWLGGTVPSEAARDAQLRQALDLLIGGLQRKAA